MKREEMLAKLKVIKTTACPTAMTYDMGLEFVFMDSTGASTILGSVGDWPLWKLPRLSLEETIKINDKIEKNTLTIGDFEGALKSFVENMLEYHKDANLNDLLKGITEYPETENDKEVFINCDVKSWEMETEYFATREEITEDFIKRFQIYTLWDDMADGDLEYFCDLIDERGEGIPFCDFEESEDDE